MTIKAIKEKMLLYNDFYGGCFLNTKEIENAKSKKDLVAIIEKHRDFLNGFLKDMVSEADSNLDRFKRSTGL